MVKESTLYYFEDELSVDNVILPSFKRLMAVMRKHPNPEKGKEALCQL